MGHRLCAWCQLLGRGGISICIFPKPAAWLWVPYRMGRGVMLVPGRSVNMHVLCAPRERRVCAFTSELQSLPAKEEDLAVSTYMLHKSYT